MKKGCPPYPLPKTFNINYSLTGLFCQAVINILFCIRLFFIYFTNNPCKFY